MPDKDVPKETDSLLDDKTAMETELTEDKLPKKHSFRNNPLLKYGFLLPTLFLAIFGVQLTLFVLNEWTQSKLKEKYLNTTNFTDETNHCKSENKSDPTYKQFQKVQREASNWMTGYTMVESIPTFFALLVLPAYTDTYGRKFLFYLTLTGQCVKALVITFTVYYNAAFYYIFCGSVVSGITGGLFATFTIASSLVADITSSGDQRTIGLVISESTIFVSTILASFVSGYLIDNDKLGFLYTSVIGTCAVGLAFLFVFLIPESLPKERRIPRQPVKGMILRMTQFYISTEFKDRRKSYIILLCSSSLGMYCFIYRNNLETLYFLGKPFCWNATSVGIFIMVRSAAQGFLGLGSLKLLQRFLANSSIAILSVISVALSYMVEAFISSKGLIYLVPVVGMFSFLVAPMIQSLMSSMTPPELQGSMFAGMSTSAVVMTLLASLTQNAIYSATLSFMGGFIFLILAIVAIINAILLTVFKLTRNPDIPYEFFPDTEVTVKSPEENKENNGTVPV